jgi:hypothetical protein
LAGLAENEDAPLQQLPQQPASSQPKTINAGYASAAVLFLTLGMFFMIYMFVDNETSLGLPIEAREKDGRCFLLDNAKFMCTVMVVFHHTCGCHDSFGFSRKFIPHPWGDYFFAAINPTHTRTFCFISGMLSRGDLKADKIFSSLVVPLLGVCFIIAPLDWLTKSTLYEGIPRKPSNWFNPLTALFAPNFSLWWYLGALIWWRILGSLIKSFPAYGRLLLACLLGAMVTYAKTPVLEGCNMASILSKLRCRTTFPI